MRQASVAERSDIELVMDTFKCDEDTAKSLIESGINVEFIRNGLDSVVEPEFHMAETAKKVVNVLSETLGELQKDS